MLGKFAEQNKIKVKSDESKRGIENGKGDGTMIRCTFSSRKAESKNEEETWLMYKSKLTNLVKVGSESFMKIDRGSEDKLHSF